MAVQRRQEIQDALLSANAGCLLAWIVAMGLPLIGLGGFFVAKGFDAVRNQARLNGRSVEVPATIRSSEVGEMETGPQAAEIGGTGVSYWPDIEFSYAYGGELRTSSKVWPVADTGSRMDAQDVIGRYPAGARVTAFVDPQDPSTAFLEKRWSPTAYLSVVVGCLPLIFVTGVGVLLVGWKRPRAARWVSWLVVLGVAGVTLFAGQHYFRTIPAGQQADWIEGILLVALLLSFAPLAALPKARALHRLYRGGGGGGADP